MLMPALRASRAWLAQTFAGLTWGRTAIVCLALYIFALSRPAVVIAVLDGKGVAAVASASVGPMVVVFGKFIPMLVMVIAGLNAVVTVVAVRLAGTAVGTPEFKTTTSGLETTNVAPE